MYVPFRRAQLHLKRGNAGDALALLQKMVAVVERHRTTIDFSEATILAPASKPALKPQGDDTPDEDVLADYDEDEFAARLLNNPSSGTPISLAQLEIRARLLMVRRGLPSVHMKH